MRVCVVGRVTAPRLAARQSHHGLPIDAAGARPRGPQIDERAGDHPPGGGVRVSARHVHGVLPLSRRRSSHGAEAAVTQGRGESIVAAVME